MKPTGSLPIHTRLGEAPAGSLGLGSLNRLPVGPVFPGAHPGRATHPSSSRGAFWFALGKDMGVHTRQAHRSLCRLVSQREARILGVQAPPGPFLSSPALPRARGPPDAMEPPLKDGHSAPAPGLEPSSEETHLPCGVQSGTWRRAGSGDASPDSGYYGHAEWPGAGVSWRPTPSSLVTQAPQ